VLILPLKKSLATIQVSVFFIPLLEIIFCTGTNIAKKAGMQNEIAQFFNNLSPQTLGLTDPISIMGLSLVAPGAIVFVVLYFGREMLRPRWRGYWDKV
jgi:hypothetical protein